MNANINDIIIESMFQKQNISREAVKNFVYHFIMYICEKNILFHINILSEIISMKIYLHY